MAEDMTHHQLEMSPLPPIMTYSSSSPIILLPPAPQLMPIQLTENNYLLWKSLFIPVLKAYNMLNHAEGREQCPPQFLTTNEGEKESRCLNPAYISWIQRDQMFLTWINASLSPKLLRYTRDCTSGQALWVHLEDVLAKSANAYVLGLKARLQNLTFSSLEEYLSKAREIVDELEAAGSPMSDREFTPRILEGLPIDYEEVVASISNQPHPVPQQELHDLLVSHRTQKRNLAHKQGLKARLQTLKYSKYNYMEAYLSEAQVIADGLKAAGSPVNDLDLTSRILEGLPKSYDELVASIRNQPHPLALQELRNLLLQQQHRRLCRKLLLPCLFFLVVVFAVIGLFIWLALRYLDSS